MRKLLLASAAGLAATVAVSGGAQAQPLKPVAPGTLVVHLNGYIQFEFAGFGSTYSNVTVPGFPKGATVVAGSAAPGEYKLNPITTDGDVRLYPGFDAQTRNGIDYGAQVELRTATSDASVGANKVTGSGSTTGSDGIYVKRAYGYIGAPMSGFVRLGQTDSAFELDQAGEIEAFGDGAQFNTDGGETSLLPSAATPGNFTYADTSNLYATDKVVYISPAVAGISFAAGYEPNSNAIKEGYGNCATAASVNAAGSATTCADETSSPLSGDIGKRRKNTVDAMVQYALKANGFVVKASGGVLYGAPISYTGALPAAGTASALRYGYDSLEVYQAGGQVTYAGLTVGANVKGGQVEDGYAFKPKGARDGLTYLIGADYVIGPVVVGGSYWNAQTAGAYVPGATIARTLSEYGVAGGANYVISPNLSLFAQYVYGHKHQPGQAFGGSSSYSTTSSVANLKTGAVKTTTTTGKENIGSVGNAQVQAIAAGLTLKW